MVIVSDLLNPKFLDSAESESYFQFRIWPNLDPNLILKLGFGRIRI